MSLNTIPQNLNTSISNARETINEQASAILTPNTARGINGFLFDIVREESLELNSEVTDHFTESNSFVNDHVVNLPARITVSGFQGELVFRRPSGIAGAVQQIQNRLETVEAYLGERTPGFVQQAQDVVTQADRAVTTINQTIDRVQNVFGLLGDESDAPTEQQRAYRTLAAMRTAKTPVTVQTPWSFWNSMIITSITLIQPENTEQMSEIEVTLKEFRTAQVRRVEFSDESALNRSEIQRAEAENLGEVRGTEEDIGPLLAGARAAGLPLAQ